ncbi:MAG TPA: sulfotransferase [Mycobacteriales bacterium]|nr:sulfotransferase [Mycobacteriales bacterium]
MRGDVTGKDVPPVPEHLARIEARYLPFEPASVWSRVSCDGDRWSEHAQALREAVARADPEAWERVRLGYLRAAALDSSALAELIRPASHLTTTVLSGAMSDDGWSSLVDAAGVVVECHRRALVVAADVAAAAQPLDEDLIARLQDLIVESQQTFSVTVDGVDRVEVDLPRRQYKPVANFLLRTGREPLAFAPPAGVPSEMRRLVAELGSDAFARLHPVVQSAYGHVALVRVHPFADGNGRLARTIASIPLLREAGLPQLILSDQWPAYLRALALADDGDPQPLVELFLAAQVNSMDLARRMLATTTAAAAPVRPPVRAPVRPPSAQRTLLDLVAVHLRELLRGQESDRRLALSRAVSGADAVRLVVEEADDRPGIDVELSVEPDPRGGWLRLTTSAGEELDVWRDDVHPAPLEMAHLRVRAWLSELLLRQDRALPASAHARGLFVLGVPRSGTTLIGNWLGSHPDVLGLAEYGAFHIAHSVAPTHLHRLPGHEHAGFLSELRRVAQEHAGRAAARQGCAWFCDATPWNLEIAGELADALPDAVFVLMLRHFAGAVVSLHQFPWAGSSWAGAAQLWADLNRSVDQLPLDRTIVVGYDVLAAHPGDTVAGLREAMQSLDLSADQFDDAQFAVSHAHVVGEPRPTVAAVVDGRVVFRSRPSLDTGRWTPHVHAEVWPIVAEVHQRLQERFGEVYQGPIRPEHVPVDQW